MSCILLNVGIQQQHILKGCEFSSPSPKRREGDPGVGPILRSPFRMILDAARRELSAQTFAKETLELGLFRTTHVG